MKREIREYKKAGSIVPEVVILDVRDILHGEYSVEKLTAEKDGYVSIYAHHDFGKCVDKAEKIFATM